MPDCAKCGGWISALVYECPACGEKPKGPAPTGLVPSEIVRGPSAAAAPPAARRPIAPPAVPTTFPKAPGPSAQAPQPLPERPAAPPARRPAVRRPTAPEESAPPADEIDPSV